MYIMMNQRVVSVGWFFVCLVVCLCGGHAARAMSTVGLEDSDTQVTAALEDNLEPAAPIVTALEGNNDLEPAQLDLQNLLTEDGEDHLAVAHENYDEDPEEHDEGHDEPCKSDKQLCQDLYRVDRWNDKGKHEEAYQKLLELNDQYADNVEVLWRLARVCKKRSDLKKYQDSREKIIFEGYNYIEQALKQNNSSFSVHKWFAILSGERGGFLGVTERIKSGGIFKKHLDIALSLKPQDTSVHHLLGMFNYKVSMLNWFERTVAETLFGDVPDTSFEQAIHHFLEARKYGAICWKANDLYIAKCHIEDGNYADAALWLERAHSLAILSDNDARMHEEVTELLEYYQEYRIRSPDDEDPARESCPTVLKNPQEVKENSSSDHCFSSWIIFVSTIVYLFSS